MNAANLKDHLAETVMKHLYFERLTNEELEGLVHAFCIRVKSCYHAGCNSKYYWNSRSSLFYYTKTSQFHICLRDCGGENWVGFCDEHAKLYLNNCGSSQMLCIDCSYFIGLTKTATLKYTHC